MCTLSVIRLRDGGVRVVMNRDESDARPRGEPAAWREVRGARLLCPLDPAGGGTWIASTRRGLLVALLNLNEGSAPRVKPTGKAHSRGLVALHVAAALDVDGACEARDASAVLEAHVREVVGDQRAGDALVLSPFRLVAIDPLGSACEHAWDGAALRPRVEAIAPVCWASSGLGDEHVQRRLPLFREFLQRGSLPLRQDEFHAHAWDDAPQFSVLMRRPGYRTVSITTAEVGDGEPRMRTVDVMPGPSGAR